MRISDWSSDVCSSDLNAAPIGTYDDELHGKIGAFLWDSNKGRNKATLADLTSKGQQKPGIVSLDGVIIDGNRRAMLLRKLEGESKSKQYFDAIILPHAYADNQDRKSTRLNSSH